MFGEWHAIDADRDRSTGEAIGIHGGSGAVWVYVVSVGVVACGVLVSEVEVKKSKKGKRELLNSARKERRLAVTCKLLP